MSCNITQGIANGCNTNIGGVKNVYLSNDGTFWYTYEMDKGTANLVETYNVNQAGSILGFTQTLTIQLSKMEAAKQLQIAKIAEANSMQVRVETNEGTVFQFGVERGAYLASGVSTSGTAYTDTNQSELVIQADSKEPMTTANVPGTTWTPIVNYTTQAGTTMEIGNWLQFKNKVLDLFETQTTRPIPAAVGNAGFNWFAASGHFPSLLNRRYTPLQCRASYTIEMEVTRDVSTGWSTYYPGIAVGLARVGQQFPSSVVSGWPSTAPAIGDVFTLTVTNYEFTMSEPTDFTADFVILVNGNYGVGLQFDFDFISGSITIEAKL